jgi:hypothetical protein
LTDVGHSPEGYDGDVAGSSAIQARRVHRIPDIAEQFSFHCESDVRFTPVYCRTAGGSLPGGRGVESTISVNTIARGSCGN